MPPNAAQLVAVLHTADLAFPGSSYRANGRCLTSEDGAPRARWPFHHFRWPLGEYMVRFQLPPDVVAIQTGARNLEGTASSPTTRDSSCGPPADVRTWWPEMTDGSALEARLREEQAHSFRRWEFWVVWTRAAHGAGVLILLVGLAMALPPPAGGEQGALRWVAFGVVLAGCAGEALWMIAWYGRRAQHANPPARGSTCPTCQLTLAHHPGCPYEGLQMRQAWVRYRQSMTNATG